MNNTIQLVIFDLDGTLVDAYSAVANSLNYTLERFGGQPVDDQRIKRSVGRGDRCLIATFLEEKRVDEALAVFRNHHARALTEGTAFLPGAGALLAMLKSRHYKLAIASNRPTRFTHIILRHLGVYEMFDHIICADKVTNPKPAADLLREVLQTFGLRPDQSVYVGDMDIDVETGRNAGMRTIAVTTGSCTREELARLEPAGIVDHALEVVEIIDGMGSG